MEKTNDAAKSWVESGKPCAYRFGWGYRGASSKSITNEEAKNLLPNYDFGNGFYQLLWSKLGGVDVLLFNELGENDLW